MPIYKIAIVGAGIGGLQAALALAHDHHDVTVFESTRKFEEVGIGMVFYSRQRADLDR